MAGNLRLSNHRLSIHDCHDRVFPRRLWRLVLLVLCLVWLFAHALLAQEPSRKVISRTLPSVPALARKMHLTGKVKLELIIAPGGVVTAARLVGGSPVYEQSAIEAVKQWKFERAVKETKQVIVFDFKTN
ncbi:MAG: energy transducer TonB [Candidatus Sulfotelmatobacter sp.]